MKKLIIDMDDVICGRGFIKMVNEFLNSNYKQEDAKSYYINDLIPKEKFEEWVKYYKGRNAYDYVELNENAVETIEKLNKEYEVYIVTAFVFRDAKEFSGTHLKNKFDYLQKILPFIKPEQYIFTTNKDIIEADIRIDDSLSKLNGKADKKLLFTAYHNLYFTDEELKEKNVTRVNNWKEIEKILL